MYLGNSLVPRRTIVRTDRVALALLLGLLAVPACLDQVASSLADPSRTNSFQAGPQSGKDARRTVIAEVGQRLKFRSDSQTTWTGEGGTVSTDGAFASFSQGSFQLVRQHGRKSVVRDTFTVVVVPPAPTLASVVVSPDTVSIAAGDTVRFSAGGRMPDGSSVDIGVTWTAPGASIDADGRYTGAPTRGTYKVIATHSTGKTDTASVFDTGLRLASAPVTATTSITLDSSATNPGVASAREWVGELAPMTSARTALTRQLDSTFAVRSDQHWAAEGAQWASANYYDRAYSHYVQFLRGGDAKYADRAAAIALNYRTLYLEPNNYGASPHWAQLEGLALHYWLTGDLASRTAVIETAKRTFAGFSLAQTADSMFTWGDGRVEARALIAALLAWKLGDTSRDWGAEADARAAIMVQKQHADGSYRMDVCGPGECPNATIWGTSNFMYGMQTSAMAKYYRLRKADPAVLTFVTKAATYLYTQWNEPARAFKYWNVPPQDSPASDVNGLIAVTFAFVAKYNGDATAGAFADHVYQAALETTWLDGGKQYNQFAYDMAAFEGLRLGQSGAH